MCSGGCSHPSSAPTPSSPPTLSLNQHPRQVPTTPAYYTFTYGDSNAHTPLASLPPCPSNKTPEQQLLDFKVLLLAGFQGVLPAPAAATLWDPFSG